MSMTDPIADFLARVMNAIRADKRRLDIPSSNMKQALAEILKQQKFINDYEVIEDNKQNILRVYLKYRNGVSAIAGLKKISKPGLRRYASKDTLPRVLNGFGIAVISTSRGLMTEKQAAKEQIGGEIVCHVW